MPNISMFNGIPNRNTNSIAQSDKTATIGEALTKSVFDGVAATQSNTISSCKSQTTINNQNDTSAAHETIRQIFQEAMAND